MARGGEYVFRMVMHRSSCYTPPINMTRHVFAKNMLAVTSDCIKGYANEVSIVLKTLVFLPCTLGRRIIIVIIILNSSEQNLHYTILQCNRNDLSQINSFSQTTFSRKDIFRSLKY